MAPKPLDVNLGPAAEKLGITLGELQAEKAVGTMPVQGNTQPFGFLHGGASALLGETLASLAANVWAARQGKVAMGSNMTINHVHPASQGIVIGTVNARHLGERTAVYSFDLVDSAGNTLSFGSFSCQIVPNRPAGQ